jgi:hypothetical protein
MPAAFDLLDQVRWFSGPDERRQIVGQPHGSGPPVGRSRGYPLKSASALLDMTCLFVGDGVTARSFGSSTL